VERPVIVAFSATGSWSVRYELITSRAGGRRVRVLLAGSEHDPLRPALFQRAAWSPDARRLAFTVESGKLAGFARDVYVIGAGGKGMRRLTSDHRSFHPVWSPDGRRIFYARRPQGRSEAVTEADARRLLSASIWSMRADGSDQRPVTRQVIGRHDLPESFAPDGATLAFTRENLVDGGDEQAEPSSAESWLMRPDGSGARRLAERSTDPSFSPDGRKIAFASDRDENGDLYSGERRYFASELYVMDADGTNRRRLTRTHDLNERAPSWLPAGTRIAYQRGEALGNAEGAVVMQANADGSCARALLADPELDTWYAAPAWRPAPARTGNAALRC
jgi:Tol biopolymer transport system component